MIIEINTLEDYEIVKIQPDTMANLGNSLSGGKAIKILNKEQTKSITLHISQEELEDIIKTFNRGMTERICPKCGKVMILCEDEKTYYQIWGCDGCGHKEDD